MYIGEPVRTMTVEPIVSPVPDGDLSGRGAELRPSPPTPMSDAAATPTTGAAATTTGDPGA